MTASKMRWFGNVMYALGALACACLCYLDFGGGFFIFFWMVVLALDVASDIRRRNDRRKVRKDMEAQGARFFAYGRKVCDHVLVRQRNPSAQLIPFRMMLGDENVYVIVFDRPVTSDDLQLAEQFAEADVYAQQHVSASSSQSTLETLITCDSTPTP